MTGPRQGPSSLQTDPIRYGDGGNIYAYVHGDPVNGTDPSGTTNVSEWYGDGTSLQWDGSGGSDRYYVEYYGHDVYRGCSGTTYGSYSSPGSGDCGFFNGPAPSTFDFGQGGGLTGGGGSSSGDAGSGGSGGLTSVSYPSNGGPPLDGVGRLAGLVAISPAVVLAVILDAFTFANPLNADEQKQLDHIQNDIHHIFDNPAHNLDPVVQQYGGKGPAYFALVNAVHVAGPPSGVFTMEVSLGGNMVTTTGFFSNGVINLSNAYIPGT